MPLIDTPSRTSTSPIENHDTDWRTGYPLEEHNARHDKGRQNGRDADFVTLIRQALSEEENQPVGRDQEYRDDPCVFDHAISPSSRRVR
jgi:hypothetical protein